MQGLFFVSAVIIPHFSPRRKKGLKIRGPSAKIVAVYCIFQGDLTDDQNRKDFFKQRHPQA
jgi:hypothetical protein